MRPLRFGMARWSGGAAVLAVLTTLFAATPAAASPPARGTASFTNATVVTHIEVPADGIGVLDYQLNCFGYTGTFKDGSRVILAQWNDGSRECFGIAPGRTIWHAWPNSGGWRQMPGNGRADDTYTTLENGQGDRMVIVWVASNNTYWCNTNPQGSASWGSWQRC